jgi:hypothetical protein
MTRRRRDDDDARRLASLSKEKGDVEAKTRSRHVTRA